MRRFVFPSIQNHQGANTGSRWHYCRERLQGSVAKDLANIARTVKHRVNGKRRTVALVDDQIRLDEKEVERQRRQVFAEMPDTWIFRQLREALNDLLDRTLGYPFACLLGKVNPDVFEIICGIR